MRKNGFAIILVLATLVLLAMLSITYIKLALIDRNIARNYMDNKRAKLLAQSGVDYALARLQEDLSGTSWQYKDELNPSFVSGTVTINGQTRGYSQAAGSTYSTNGDLFILKITDSQSKININDGLGNPRVRANLARIVNNLVKQNTVIGPASPDIGFDIVGTELDEKRPAGGYSNVSELKRILTSKYGAIGEDYYRGLEPFVTTHAWQDKNVANPVPLSSTMVDLDVYPVKYNKNIGIYRYGRGKASDGHVIGTAAGEAVYAQLKFAPEGIGSPLGTGDPRLLEHAIYGLDELNPQWIEIVSRSPVNVNTAPKEVLIALIKDLKGLFVVERKANELVSGNIVQLNKLYGAMRISPDYAPNPAITNPDAIVINGINYDVNGLFAGDYEEPRCDELGFIYSTLDINYDFLTNTGLANKIADEMIKCRNNDPSYSLQWFKGPFKNWRQFNAFCDYLLTKIDPDDPSKKILEDTRNIFYEYEYYLSGTFYYRLVLSAIARQYASQALSDLLKANFNPNLHLNELNPDANITTFVDKTDLIVNSTEFCFLPMGYFEIESQGLILRQETPIAQSRYKASVKLYDAYRETNQRQFLQGQIPDTPARTNNGKTLETGPEPGNTIATENNWSGYIALPTMRGQGGFSIPPPTETWDRYQGNDRRTITTTYPLCRLYSQFTNNFNADYHIDQGTDPTVVENQTQEFESDPTEIKPDGIAETTVGPYNLSTRNRLARSYKVSDTIDPKYYAPADLRKDGVYIERHNGIAYKSLRNVLEQKGIFSYWIKPWFHPEMTGKPRIFVSVSYLKYVYESPFYKYIRNQFAHFFVPGHVNDSNFTTAMEDSTIDYEDNFLPFLGVVDFRPLSMAFGYATIAQIKSFNEGVGGLGKITPTLNHLSHFNQSCYPAGASPRTNYMKSSQWLHVILLYDKQPSGVNEYTDIYVNGNIIAGTLQPINSHAEDINISDFQRTRLKIGHPAKIAVDIDAWNNCIAPGPLTSTCDATIDEFYVFSALSETKTQTTVYNKDGSVDSDTTTWSSTDSTTDAYNLANMWVEGRYYRPSPVDCYFISGNLSEITSQSVNIADTSQIPDPLGAAPLAGAINSGTLKILGISWTYFAEGTNQAGECILHDYYNYALADRDDTSTHLKVNVSISFQKNGAPLPTEYTDDAYSPVSGLEFIPADDVRYKVLFRINNLTATSVLLYSPIFDDITIYYTDGVKFMSYSCND